jgi:probable F420-dependent oxidoreductase
MKFGVFLPLSGRAAGPDTLSAAATQAETLGYEAVWAADRIVIPWEIKTPYPYGEDERFIVPADRPFLEPLSCLSFLAGRTKRVRLGISVLVLPYRHPLYWAKVATTLDSLSRGRFILGVGVGWMAEEFEALGVAFHQRGEMSDEQLSALQGLWTDDRAQFQGRYYRFKDIAFYPKPTQTPRIPIWVGGESARALRRAALFGDAWFPYFVKITPTELADRFGEVRRWAVESGKEPERISLNCCLPIEVAHKSVAQEAGRLKGSPEQLIESLEGYRKIGVRHLALQFMVPNWPARQEEIERFGRDVLPAFSQCS